MAELEVSFGPKSAPPPPPPVVEKAPEPIAPHLAKRAVQTFDLDPRHVNFETDSTKLVRGSQQYLRRLARALAANRHLFDKVEIIGHADQRGPERYNDKLSKRRARAIADTMISAGISRSQVRTEGLGESNLLSTSMSPSSLLRNRRAQMEFEGVKNAEALKNIIDSVNR
jgi:OmpA-OmpF porin, OOP family